MRTMKKFELKRMIISALLLALALVLPFLTGQIKQIGNMLLPMHLPVFLCSFICGPWYGLSVGVVAPLLRSALFGMPHLYPNAVAMAFELAAYGFFADFIYRRMGAKGLRALYTALLGSMVLGRVVWGVAEVVLLGLGGKTFTFGAFVAGALTSAVLGIALQLVLIPTIMTALQRARVVPLEREKRS